MHLKFINYLSSYPCLNITLMFKKANAAENIRNKINVQGLKEKTTVILVY